MSNFDDLFNPNVEQAAVQKNSELYKVSAKNGINGVYRSVIRFIPWYVEPHSSAVSKTVAWVKNPATQQGMYVDDPKSNGQHSPISDMYWNLYNTKNKTYQDFAKAHLGSKQQWASLVQIIQDEQHPEYVGEIKVFTFGKKIWDKLYAEMNPRVGQKGNPWQPITGRYFAIECQLQSGFNNFDNSMFFDNKSPDGKSIMPSGMLIKNPQTGTLEQVTESTDQQRVVEYLQQASPDLGAYKYKEMTPEQRQFVADTIAVITDMMSKGTIGKTPMETISGGYNNGMTMNPAPQFPGTTMQPSIGYGFSQGYQPQGFQQQSQGFQQQPMMQQPSPSVGGFAQPQQNIQPQMFTQPQTASQQGTGNVTGVDLPNITPTSAPAPEAPAVNNGFGNIDDILGTL